MSDEFEIAPERKLAGRADEAAGGHRRWSRKVKARILAESFEPGVKVAEVARRNGLSPQRLYSWRNQARAVLKDDGDGDNGDENGGTAAAVSPRGFCQQERLIGNGDRTPQFVPVTMAAPGSSSPPSGALLSSPLPPSSSASGTIEIVIADMVVRVRGDVEAAALATVLVAIKEAS